MDNILKWDMRYLKMAEHIAMWSKDPSTKVGAVIVRSDNTICSLGYNGFPRKISDKGYRLNNRDIKYRLMIHAEINAILNSKEPLNGYTIYVWPIMPCERCMVQVIQAGIKRVVSLAIDNERWKDSMELAKEIADETGVEVVLY